jgi:hypothetical protein
VNTVSAVNRVTGVEGGVRWFLGGRRPSHHKPTNVEANGGSNKRRKVDTDNLDSETDRNVSRDPYPVQRVELQHRERRLSQGSAVESLPAYDEHRSPSYEMAQQALVPQPQPASPGASWQSRLMLSTSGLSIAMSEESLRSLKYCLSWLRWANEHIGKVIEALKAVLEEFDGSASAGAITADGRANGALIVRSEAERGRVNKRIAELKGDILKTLKDVVDVVSKYAGGALPENARVLVRRHLTSLPQRFRLASNSSKSAREGSINGEDEKENEVREGARRVMVLAREGLDMMGQVSGVLDGTIVSAEEWCERLGKKKREENAADANNKAAAPLPAPGPEEAPTPEPVVYDNDVKMG